MEQVVKALQSVTSLPLQLDSSNVEALARGLRVYNGKPIVNSTNGEPEKLAAILPLCKKYGAAIVGLAIDEKASSPKPQTAWPLPAASPRQRWQQASLGKISTSTALP